MHCGTAHHRRHPQHHRWGRGEGEGREGGEGGGRLFRVCERLGKVRRGGRIDR